MSTDASQSTQSVPDSESQNHQDAQDRQDQGASEQVQSDFQEISSIIPSVEAMLVSSDRPLKIAALVDALTAHLATPLSTKHIEQAIDELNTQYGTQGRAFRIEKISGGYRLMTCPEHAPIVATMHRSRATTRLSKPALETLSIIAYRQPITRAELESIRGVACGEVVRTLMDRRLVKITGRAEELGRPMLYGTTRQFLDTFGLASVKDLPKPEELADQRGETS